MKRLALGLAASLALSASGAQAGVYADDLTRCLVQHTTPEDQNAFIVWMFAALGAHPVTKPYINMTPAQRDAATKVTAGLMERLMTVDCHKETVVALKYEGNASIEAAFSYFGQAATRGLLTNADVNTELGKLGGYVDMKKFQALGEEAGVAKPPPTK